MNRFASILLVATLVGSSAATSRAASPLSRATVLPGPFALAMQQPGSEYDGYYDSYYEPRNDAGAAPDRGYQPADRGNQDEVESYYEFKPPLVPDGVNSPYRIYPQYYPRRDAMWRGYAE